MRGSGFARGILTAALCSALIGCSPAEQDPAPLPPRDCPDSELPAPFCHRTVDAGSLYGWKHYRLGFVDEMRDGVRPFLGATLHPLSFALFDPLNVEQPLVEVPGPLPSAGSIGQLAEGDFDGDGDDELALSLSPSGSDGDRLVILDGRTLNAEVTADFARSGVFALDVDGDERAELLTISGEESNESLQAWVVRDGALLEVGAAELPLARRAQAARGDFDGDSRLDLALTAFDADDEPAPVLVLRGGSASGPTLPLVSSPRPPMLETAVAADVDGDDDHELVVFHTASTMTVMEWTAEGLTPSESITLDTGSDMDSSSVRVRVGEDQGRPDWLVIGSFHIPGEPSWHFFDAAVFFGPTGVQFIPLEFAPILVADYDDDGLSDFSVGAVDATVYLSDG